MLRLLRHSAITAASRLLFVYRGHPPSGTTGIVATGTPHPIAAGVRFCSAWVAVFDRDDVFLAAPPAYGFGAVDASKIGRPRGVTWSMRAAAVLTIDRAASGSKLSKCAQATAQAISRN